MVLWRIEVNEIILQLKVIGLQGDFSTIIECGNGCKRVDKMREEVVILIQ